MIIDSVEVFTLDVPLSDPFEISLGTKTAATNVVVRVETADGTIGYGEGAPLEPITGETQQTAVAAAQAGARLLEGRDLRDRRELVLELKNALPGTASSRFALETALFDAYSRERTIPITECFGGSPTPIETDVTVSMVDPETAAEEAAEAIDAGYEELKVKVGGDVGQDLDRVTVVRETAPEAGVKVDANQGWTPKESIQFADRARDRGLDLALIEQPVRRDDIEGLLRVTTAVDVPIAADEAVFTPADAQRIAARRAADVVNIKAGKSGLIDGAEIAAIARSANLELMVGCMLESAIGLHASAHLIAGLGGFSYVDLDGNVSFREPVGDVTPGPTLDIRGPGHGIVPDETFLSQP